MPIGLILLVPLTMQTRFLPPEAGSSIAAKAAMAKGAKSVFIRRVVWWKYSFLYRVNLKSELEAGARTPRA